MDVLTILIVLALLATFATMLMGLIAMGNESLDKELSQPLMWTRVGLQSIAILLLFMAILLR